MGKYSDNAAKAGADYVKAQKTDVAIPKGADESLLTKGEFYTSALNKLHLVKLADNLSPDERKIINDPRFAAKDFTDLCSMELNAQQYEADDFLYCKNLGYPMNRLITLRRFPLPCTDNIWDKESQGEPDIARLVTFYDQEVNKLDEILPFNYAMNWKELTSEFETMSMEGNQSGLSGMMEKAAFFVDPELQRNKLKGQNALAYDPKSDGNKVFGEVDSIINTHIREVGLTFDKEFQLTFDYDLKSWNARTPEYAMRDMLANILAVTHNNGKFWGGARYWVGERPSGFYKKIQYLNSGDMDKILGNGYKDIRSVLQNFGSGGSAVDTLKKAIKGGAALGMSKILDKVGRPSILVMNSLLSAEATGNWHLTVGNPHNPIMCVGNLIVTGCEVNFPTDSLSYGEFPTKLTVKVNLKPAQAKERAGIETMFNYGKHRIYYAPKKVDVNHDRSAVKNTARSFFGFSEKAVDNMLTQAYDFIADGVKSVSTTVKPALNDLKKSGNDFLAQNQATNELAQNSEV